MRVNVTVSSTLVTLVHTLVAKHVSPSTSSLGAVTLNGTIEMSAVAPSDDADASLPSWVGTGVAIPARVRAHAFIALGKLCLRDGALAKRVVHMLVRELRDVSSDIAVRSNVLLVLCDLCVRYTAIGA